MSTVGYIYETRVSNSLGLSSTCLHSLYWTLEALVTTDDESRILSACVRTAWTRTRQQRSSLLFTSIPAVSCLFSALWFLSELPPADMFKLGIQAGSKWVMCFALLCFCLLRSFSSSQTFLLAFFLFLPPPPSLPRWWAGVYTAYFVQERGAAAQHFSCHGEHGFGCLHRRGNRDFLSRYEAAMNLRVMMMMMMITHHPRNLKRYPPAQEVTFTSYGGTPCDLTGEPLQLSSGSARVCATQM